VLDLVDDDEVHKFYLTSKLYKQVSRRVRQETNSSTQNQVSK